MVLLLVMLLVLVGKRRPARLGRKVRAELGGGYRVVQLRLGVLAMIIVVLVDEAVLVDRRLIIVLLSHQFLRTPLCVESASEHEAVDRSFVLRVVLLALDVILLG